MNQDRWDDINRILDALFDLEEQGEVDVEAALDRLCGGDAELRREVEAALATEAPTFLDRDAADLADTMIQEVGDRPPTVAEPGAQVGPYRLVRELGRGGMGVVYLAARADGQFQRDVALKLLPRAFESTRRVARFRAERQILASLTHPSIASLLDGGVTEAGRPFLVMEYVDGVPITDYCKTHGCSVEERLRLLQQVCAAVQHAHRRLVVHRDLKPGNILVAETPEGPQVKLLDFGIAKLLDEEAERLQTRTGERMLTPQYAAPEQVREEAITTATDVYQLGVLAYELLTGERPFSLEGKSLTEIEQAILDVDPDPPSAARTRSAGTVSQARALRGDLDTIVLKALRKEPERRYGSPEALSEDIRRYLHEEPIRARPTTLVYRLRKFARRNWGAVAGVLVVTGLLAAYLMTLHVQNEQIRAERDRVRQEAVRAEALSDFLTSLFAANDPRRTSGRELTALDLLERGRERLQRLPATSTPSQLHLRAALGGVYIQLGRYREADSVLFEPVEPSSDIGQAAPPDRGELYLERSNLRKAEERYREADSLLTLAEQISEQTGHLDSLRTAEIVASRAFLQYALGDYPRSDSLFAEAATRYRALFGDEHAYYATILSNWTSLLVDRRKLDEARRVAEEALRIRQTLFETPHIDIAYSLGSFGAVLREAGSNEKAKRYLQEALDMKRAVLGDGHPELAVAHGQLALVTSNLGQYREAEELFLRAIELSHARDSSGLGALIMRGHLALLYQNQGRLQEAVAVQEQVLATKRGVVGSDRHPSIVVTLYNLATVLHEMGRYSRAETLLRRVVELDVELRGADHPEVGVDLLRLAVVVRDRGQLAEADSLLAEARPLLEAGFPDRHRRHTEWLAEAGALRVLQGRPDEGRRFLQAALQRYQESAGDSPWRVAEVRTWLGRALAALNDREAARRILRQAHDAFEQHLGPEHRRTRRAEQFLKEV